MANNQITGNQQKILFITQEDPFYIKVFFEEFFEHFANLNNILGVVICPTMGKRSIEALAKQMFKFYGPVDFLRMCWRYAAVKARNTTLKRLCDKFSIPVFETEDVNGEAFITSWKEKGVDVLISVAAPAVFKEKLIGLPRWGCINIHHAKLPNYRGMMPNFWQMYHSEKTAGITVHRINRKIDEGEIILQKEIPIRDEYSLDSLIKHSKKMGARCIIEALDLIRDNKVVYITNESAQGSYFSFPKPPDVNEFRMRGKRIL